MLKHETTTHMSYHLIIVKFVINANIANNMSLFNNSSSRIKNKIYIK